MAERNISRVIKGVNCECTRIPNTETGPRSVL
jgi:hypothetical protein